MRNIYVTILLCMSVMAALAQSNPTKTILDNTGTVTWSSDTTYILDGFVFVDSLDVLTIEPGTVIKGKPGQGSDASALIVARGGKIMAEGTPTNPIIFTGEQDDITNPVDVGVNETGLWGGVIILGTASLNSSPGETAIEGIPTTEPRGLYGTLGTPDDDDNSGVFRYVSIRHGGTDIGAGNEINGLTLGGVGRGTTIDHVEVIFNADDGVEYFGGTVNTSHLIVAFCDDDSYDYDEGFRGKGQFWVTIQDTAATSDRGGEHDGGTDPETGTPFAKPMVYNATYIGSKENRALTFRDNAGGTYRNSIFYDYSKGVDIEILGNGSEHSYDRLLAGDLVLENNIFWNVAGNNAADIFKVSAQKFGSVSLSDSTAIVDSADAAISARFAAGNNVNVDPVLASVNRMFNMNGMDLRPAPNGPAFDDLAPYPSDPFFQKVPYKGAFSNSTSNWARHWTYLEDLGYFPPIMNDTITVVDNTGDGTTIWTSNNVYRLDGFVFVDSTDTLIIEPGTVIQGLPGQGADASALIVARGGYIHAVGSPEEPIIFTGSTDDTNNPVDVPANETGLWGGVIILGTASLNSSPGETAIEGIPTTEPRGLYGTLGTPDDDDNSGIFRYVSIRHGGTDIGAGNEINGLTLGGVGRGTTIDHVEVIFNADDGVEFFGGTVNTSNMVVAFCDDDSYDYDEGFRGKGQFWVTIQSTDATSDRAGEHDGGTDPETGTPFATPEVYNATYIGSGANRTLTFRDNAGGTYKNSIFVDYDKGVDIEILGNGSQHSYDRFLAGELVLENNIFWNVASNVPADIFKVSAQKFGGVPLADSTAIVDSADVAISAGFAAGNNENVDPLLASISRAQDNMLDPRPSRDGAAPAYMNLAAYPADPFFVEVDYKGAFANGRDLWLKTWTGLEHYGYLPSFETITSIKEEIKEEIRTAIKLYPNPNQGSFTVAMEDLKLGPVTFEVYSLTGNRVLVESTEPFAGNIELNINMKDMPASMYILKASQENRVIGITRFVKQ